MFYCRACRTVFDEAESARRLENLDGENGWWEHWDDVCPVCGSDEFEEIEEDAW